MTRSYYGGFVIGAKRVRQLFAAAKAKAPCVLFIDEIDTCGAKRTSSQLHPYANQTINQLLAEMDGFNKSEGVVVLGAYIILQWVLRDPKNCVDCTIENPCP